MVFKKKQRYVVKNTALNRYAGESAVSGWVSERKNARRFNSLEDAQYVANVLSIVALADCVAQPESNQ